MFNGTSMASPQAAGAAALLLSAAKADRPRRHPGRSCAGRSTRSADCDRRRPGVRRRATASSTSPGAWTLLRERVATRGRTPSTRRSAPRSRDFLATPDQGTGIYNRCAAGRRRPRGRARPRRTTVTVTRTSGPAGSVAHRLACVGNDGTFSRADAGASLPLNEPVTDHRSRPSRPPGAHSAILRIDDPATAGRRPRGACTVVVAAATLGGAGVLVRDRAARSSATSQVATSSRCRRAPRRCRSTCPASPPARRPGSSPSTRTASRWRARPAWSATPTSPTRRPATRTSRAYAEPAARASGRSRSSRGAPRRRWTTRSSSRRAVQGVTVDPAVVELPVGRRPGVPTPVTWTVTNDFGPVTVQRPGRPAGQLVHRRGRPSPTGDVAEVHGRGAGGRDPAGRRDRQHQRPGRRPRPLRLPRTASRSARTPTATPRSR